MVRQRSLPHLRECRSASWLGSQLGLEGASAAATLGGVWIFEREALFLKTLVPIDGGAIEVQRAFLVDDNGNTVAFVLGVNFVIELVVEVQRVAESAATAGRNPDSQHHVVAEVVFFLKPLHFFGGSFA